MAIINLLQTLTSKTPGTFTVFLNSYNELKHMKNISGNLTAMSQCLITEHSQGLAKCMTYFIANEIDNLILQLYQQVDLEPFYISIMPLFSEDHLNSELFRTIWKYGIYKKLSKLYSERCVSLRIFNHEFGVWCVENFPSLRDSIIILTGLDEYVKLFKDLGLDLVAINQANTNIVNMSENAIETLEFLIYYGDKTGQDVLESIKIECNITRDLQTSKVMSFLFTIYKKVQSSVIRLKILGYVTDLTECGFMNGDSLVSFLLEIIKIDSTPVFEMLNEFQECSWKSFEVWEILVNQDLNIDSEENETVDSSKEVIVFNDQEDVISHSMLMKVFEDQKICEVLLKSANTKLPFVKKSRLLSVLKNRYDLQVLTLLLFVNDTLVLNDLVEISKMIAGDCPEEQCAFYRLILRKFVWL